MNSVPLPDVRSQRAAIKVDTEAASFSGWTELRVATAAAFASDAHGLPGSLGFHCYGLGVQSVTVNDQPVSFELQPPVREELPDAVTAAGYENPHRQITAVAEASFYLYERQLQRERAPELLITLPPSLQQQASHAKGVTADGKPGLRVRIEFTGDSSGAGVRFWQHYACTDNQVRRTSAWLPCVDSPSAMTWFQLDITCRASQMAVGPGQLRRQSWADVARDWRTFHYSVPVSCAPCQLGFAVGTFHVTAQEAPAKLQQHATAQLSSAAADEAVNGATNGLSNSKQQPQPRQLTHFVPKQLPRELEVAMVLAAPPVTTPEEAHLAAQAAAAADGVARTAHFFTLAFTFTEEVLGVQWPLPAVQQVFLPPELAPSEAQALAGLSMLGTADLIVPRAIEQSITARCAIARCLARQWFGVVLRAATPADMWLVEGLSGWLEEQCVRKYLGRNELAYRRWRERQAIFAADNGEVPPLAARGVAPASPWGPLYGTERLDPSHIWSTKATAVIAMLERRAGEELFRKHVATIVQGAVEALQVEQAQAAASGGNVTAIPGAGKVPASPTPTQATAVPAPSPQQGGGGTGAGSTSVGSRLLDTMAFLNDLGRAGSFRKEMGPFAARWVFGRGVPHITGAFVYHSRTNVLELGLKQAGPESAKRAADVAERAAVAEGSNAGIIKAVVREGDQYTDHPVHLGGEAFVLAELKVTPVVEKKVPGRRGRKRKGEGEGEGQPQVAQTDVLSPTPEEPVMWVRLDPAGEQLCDIRLMQPERMLAAQLLQSRDVVAQAEAVQRLSELRVESLRPRQLGLEALRTTLHDRAVFYRVRCDAALALAKLRDELGQPAGLPVLLEFYRGAYFVPGSDTPRSVGISDPSEYFVAQAVATAVSLCREPDDTTPFDALLFLSTCLTDYASVPGAPFSDYGLVAALCASLGNVRFEGFGDSLLTLLEKFLERDAVLVSPGGAVGCACLAAMAALYPTVTCGEEERAQIDSIVRRVQQSPSLPATVRNGALAASLHLAVARRGPTAALLLAVAAAEAALQGRAEDLLLPSPAAPALLLEETLQIAAAAAAAAQSHAAVAQLFMGSQQPDGGPTTGNAAAIVVPMPLLQRLAALLNAGEQCRVRHLAFVLLQLLAGQPPTLYRPLSNEAEEEVLAQFVGHGAAAAAAQAASVGAGATHRTGQQASPAAVPAAKIRIQIGGGAGGMAKSMAMSGEASQPAMSEGGPAVSDARALSYGAVEQPPAEAQGQVFSPVHAAVEAAAAPFGTVAAENGGQEASSAQQEAPLQQAGAVPPAPAPAPRFRLKVSSQPQQPQHQAAPAPMQDMQLEQAWQAQQALAPALPPASSVAPVQPTAAGWEAAAAAWAQAAPAPQAPPQQQQQLPTAQPATAAPKPQKIKLRVKLPSSQ